MENFPIDTRPAVIHAEPVLAVNNVVETVDYWHEVFGFPNKWTWGSPANHGGVSWDGGAFVQFSLNPKLAAIGSGQSIWFRVRSVTQLYELHQKKATIVSPLQDMPYGFSEYTVRDLNGYYLSFAAPFADKKGEDKILKENIVLTARTPSMEEYQRLAASVGWTANDEGSIRDQWQSAAYAVVAEKGTSGEAIGCAFLMGDNKSFYYVKDVIVHHAWQRMGIGTLMMRDLTNWLEVHAPNNATVGLFTGDHLTSFYRQFGFMQACGMYRQVQRPR